MTFFIGWCLFWSVGLMALAVWANPRQHDYIEQENFTDHLDRLRLPLPPKM